MIKAGEASASPEGWAGLPDAKGSTPLVALRSDRKLSERKDEMGWSVLPRPGTEYGPCEEKCEHRDCAQTRKMAEAECSICDKEIGYDRGFYLRTNEPLDMVHSVCAHEEANE